MIENYQKVSGVNSVSNKIKKEDFLLIFKHYVILELKYIVDLRRRRRRHREISKELLWLRNKVVDPYPLILNFPALN